MTLSEKWIDSIEGTVEALRDKVFLDGVDDHQTK